MPEKHRILLINDDGADAPGLWALYHSIRTIAEPVVVAPMTQQSACSHAVTIRKRMTISPIEHGGQTVGYRLDGTPTDCVKLALAHLYRDQIDLVISGINWGSNVGQSVLYSGTVAAAIEAAMYGLPAIAVSIHDERDQPVHLDTAAIVTQRLALNVLQHGLPRGVILNVNVPDLPLDQIAGAVVTLQGMESYVDHFKIEQSGAGGQWCINVGSERLASPATDVALDDRALADRRISITPLDFDLTSRSSIQDLRQRIAGLRLA